MEVQLMDELAVYQFIMNNGILMVPLYFVQGYLLAYFCGNFVDERLKGRRWNRAAVTVLFFLLRYIFWRWGPDNWTAKVAVVYLIWILGITAILVFVFYKASYGITTFLAVTFAAINECSGMIAYTFLQMEMNLLGEFWVWCVECEYILFKTFLTVMEVSGIVAILLCDTLTAALMYIFLKKVIKTFQQKDYEIHRTELLFLLTPGMTGLLICVLLRTIMLSVESGTLKLLYNSYPLLVPVVPAIMLLCMMSVCYSVKLFQDMIRLNQERNSKVVLERQIGSMQEHITEIERLYSGIRNIKHDMRNTLSIVMQLSSGNERADKEELDAYLTELNRTLDKLELNYRTGNAVADTLLNMKYHEILRVMPECKLDADQLIFPAGLIIQSYDYGVILGNALDNAMEACKRLYEQGSKDYLFIRLSSFRRGNQFFIEIANSFDGRVFREKEKEFPETYKVDKKLHGMGLYHIKSTVEKYYGAVEWSAVDKVFTLTVMMQNQRRPENEL